MAKIYGKINGKGRMVYIKTVYAEDVERLRSQGNVMYVTHGVRGYRTYTNLRYEFDT